MKAEGTKILVVDDNPNNLVVLSNVLDLNGYTVSYAPDGTAGLETAASESPDLILLDAIMPDMDGFETCRELKRSERTKHIPVIFMTALTETSDKLKGFECGAVDYITKPIHPEEVLARVKIHLSMGRLYRTLNTEIQELSEKHASLSKQMQDLRRNLSRTLPHELRTPLNAILGFSRFLVSFDPEQLPDQENVLQIRSAIYNSALRLQRLVENYLLYASLLLMQYDMEKSTREGWRRQDRFRTDSLIACLASAAAEKAARRDDLRLSLTKKPVRGSERSIRKILEELLDNAIKFSEPGTPIDIVTEGEDCHWSLHVRDQGHGMTPDQIAAIGAFMQFDRDEYEQQGSGLGLTITRMLTHMNNGEVSIESSPGQGATVTVTF